MASVVRSVQRQSLDITGKINLADPLVVCAEITVIFQRLYAQLDFDSERVGECGADGIAGLFHSVFNDIIDLYTGRVPGYYACDTQYHDICHVMDVALAMARLVDGYERAETHSPLGYQRAVLGLVVALFHDSGYIRCSRDTQYKHGAEYTKTHVSRSAQFLAEYLPRYGMQDKVRLAQDLVHYTGYEVDSRLDDRQDHLLGCLLGTADLIAQMSARAYLEKCRDDLFVEFKIGKVNKVKVSELGAAIPVDGEYYTNAEQLLYGTPDFMRITRQDRLDRLFDGVYDYATYHFGGENPYLDGLEKNLHYIEQQLDQGGSFILRRCRSIAY